MVLPGNLSFSQCSAIIHLFSGRTADDVPTKRLYLHRYVIDRWEKIITLCLVATFNRPVFNFNKSVCNLTSLLWKAVRSSIPQYTNITFRLPCCVNSISGFHHGLNMEHMQYINSKFFPWNRYLVTAVKFLAAVPVFYLWCHFFRRVHTVAKWAY